MKSAGSSTDKGPTVSIGVPAYNRPELLALALESFRQQTFPDFEVIISDNASPDPDVQKVAQRFVEMDRRFRYVRQPTNQGAIANFWYVYRQACAPYFFWASDDDVWPPNFIERGLAALEVNSEASGWFCQIVNIDAQGKVVRTYPSFSRFQSTRFKAFDLARYLFEPEVKGKANLIYAFFRREAVQSILDRFHDQPDAWGIDMAWVYAFLCRKNLVIDDTVMVQKRVPSGIEFNLEATEHSVISRGSTTEYFRNYRTAASGSGYEGYTDAVLRLRWGVDYVRNKWWRQDLGRGWRYSVAAIKAAFKR